MGRVKCYECPITAITNQTWEIIKIVNQTSDEHGKPQSVNYFDYKRLPPWLKQAYLITQRERAAFREEQAAKRGK